MLVTSPKELFLMLLSDARQSTEKAVDIYLELAQLLLDPQIKKALTMRALASEETIPTLDQCFNLIGEQPIRMHGHLQEFFMEEFRKEITSLIRSMVEKKTIARKAAVQAA